MNQNENCFSRVDTVLNIETRSWSKHKDTKTLWRKAQAGAEATLHHGGVPRSARLHLCGISLGQPTPCWADNTNVSAHCVCARVRLWERERRCVWVCGRLNMQLTARDRNGEAEGKRGRVQSIIRAESFTRSAVSLYTLYTVFGISVAGLILWPGKWLYLRSPWRK